MTEQVLRVLDFETTGFPPEACVCEAAFVDLQNADIVRNWSTLVIPTMDMGLEALAVHHITAEDATDNGISWGEAHQELVSSDVIYVAHNAAFEQKFFNPAESTWIDTYKVALKLWPDAPRHTNQVLRYYLGVEGGAELMPPHRALPDCYVTAAILLKALEIAPIDDLISWTGKAPFLTKMPFGKHKGMKFEDIPRSYLSWLSNQDKIDEGVRAAARKHL